MSKKPDFAGDLRERVARAIYAKRPDCQRKPFPVNTAEEKRAYPHNPIAAVDLSYEYADAAITVIQAEVDAIKVAERRRVLETEGRNRGFNIKT